MHADWVKLMSTYSSTDGVLIASADCSTQSRQPGSGADLCNHYNLPYYPYIVYGDPSNVQEYQGNRDYNSLLSFARSHLGSEVEETQPEVNGGTLNLSWKDCGDSTYHGKITGLDKSSITLGEDTTVTGSGTSDEAIEGGDFTITAKAGPITQKYQGKVCEAKEFDLPLGLGKVNWKGLSCPAAAGDLSVGVGVKLASVIPAKFATADIEVSATGASADDKLLCMSLHASPASQLVCPKNMLV
jgi:hypothetical protein